MRGIHIYKIHSRLGLKNPPAGSHTHNVGVEDGPDAVLSASFIAKLHSASHISSYTFPKPERVSGGSYRETLARHILSCANDLRTKTNGAVPVTVGGDHSIAASSLLSLLTRKHSKDVGYIQFDSHADINSFETSPSGNFHGMWLRPFLETMDDAHIARVIPTRLPASHVCFIGNMQLDPGEKEFIHKKRITHFSQRDIRHNGIVKTHLKTMIRRFKHLHIGFDIDIFHASLVAATGTPNDEGLFPNDVFPLLRIVAQHPSISIDLVEVNPKKKGATKTIRLAQDVLTTLLQRQV